FTDLLEKHRALLRAELTGGVEFGTEGDAVFAAFPSATDAVTAAARGQRALADADWPEGAAVRVRMGISTGEVEALSGKYVGLESPRAAGICAPPHGGKGLVSSRTGAFSRRLPDDLTLQSLGVHLLKDFDEGEELFQVCAAWLEQQFPPPRTARARSVHLP